MSMSPSIRKQTSSPIRSLENNSPGKLNKLHTILEEDADLIRKSILSNTILQTENINLSYENQILNNQVKNYADENMKFVIANNKLKQENQILLTNNYYTNSLQIQKLNLDILYRDSEAQSLRSNMQLMKTNYDRNVDHFILENQNLKNQLMELEYNKIAETKSIKEKFAIIAQEDLHLAKKGYNEDIARLSINLQSTKDLLSEKQLQLKHLQVQGQNSVMEQNAYLEQLISENNILRNSILQIQIKKQNELKQLSAMKQLQKSRTYGIITYCKQNTAFMEKQISKLAEELLQKSISIEQFTKDMIKIRKNLEQTQKRYEQKIVKVQTQCDQKIHQIQQEMQKLQKYHKQQAAVSKKVELELQEMIATKEHQFETLQRQNEHHKQIIKDREQEIQNCKATISKMHDDHAKEMNKVMTDSKYKRKSARNLSEVSSLRDLSASSGSLHNKNIQRTISLNQQQENQIKKLQIVEEQEIGASKIVRNIEQEQHGQVEIQQIQEQEDVAVRDLVLHYQNMLQEMKKDKELQRNLAKESIDKLNKTLQQKQQQVLQILQRFSPLMEYKINSTSLQVERKQKIEKHYKANIDLLSVMLDKYGISALSKQE